MPFFFLVTAQRKQVPRKTRGTRLRIGCLILSCKVFLNELSPRQHLVETLWVGLDLHVRQILEKELDIISGRKVVCLCCFHNAVDHCAGFCAGRRVAEQPVLSADCKGVDLVLCTIVGDFVARILQIVFHIRALSLSVLHCLFQATGQWLCAELIQPTPKSPKHRLFDRKALFLPLFRRKPLYFFFSCKELVTKVPPDLCRYRRITFRRHSLHELSSQMRPTAAACDMRDLVISGIAMPFAVFASAKPHGTRAFARLFVHAGVRFPRPFAGAIGTLFENAKLIFPPGAVETASAAIFIISGTTGLIAVKSRLLLHEQFKRPLLALCEIHSGCTSFPAGIKKRRYFLPQRG